MAVQTVMTDVNCWATQLTGDDLAIVLPHSCEVMSELIVDSTRADPINALRTSLASICEGF